MAVYVEPEETEEEIRRRRRRVRIVLVALIVFGIAWAIAIAYSVTADNPERLRDENYDAISAACVDALEDLRALPDLDENSDARDAAALIRDENEIFLTIVAAGRAADEPGDAAVALDAWLDDWETVIDARAEHADRIATTGEGQFLSPLEVILRIKEYAEAQGLFECAPETLQQDVVDTPRFYPEDEE